MKFQDDQTFEQCIHETNIQSKTKIVRSSNTENENTCLSDRNYTVQYQ